MREPAEPVDEDFLAALRLNYIVRFLPREVKGRHGRWVGVVFPFRVRDALYEPDLYYVDDSRLRATTEGLQYRASKNLADRTREAARWDSYVRGRGAGDGWALVLLGRRQDRDSGGGAGGGGEGGGDRGRGARGASGGPEPGGDGPPPGASDAAEHPISAGAAGLRDRISRALLGPQ